MSPALLFVYAGAVGSVITYFSSSLQSHSIINAKCTGNESTLQDCPRDELNGYECSISRDANVFCQCKFLNIVNLY